MKISTTKIPIQNTTIDLNMRREDLIHPIVSGNKFRKLKYNLMQARDHNQTSILTFGGAFSNHIAATAYAGMQNGFKTIGVIRGDETDLKINLNATLKFAASCGMIFKFVSRAAYRNKDNFDFIEDLQKQFGDFYVLPEGGTNDLAVKGCEEIITNHDYCYDYICTCVGTGGTISGIINSSFSHQKILGFPALKGDFLQKDIRKFAVNQNWQLIDGYDFGGYAKNTPILIDFMNDFFKEYKILLDPIYTAKMVFGVLDLIKNKFFQENSKILMIHSGGLQGIEGMNEILKKKKATQIVTHV